MKQIIARLKAPDGRHWAAIAGACVIAVVVGWWIVGPASHDGHADHPERRSADETQGKIIGTCAMHPQIRLPMPGKCPICFMDLIPVEASGGKVGDEFRHVMSQAARKAARVAVLPVVRDRAYVSVRMVGLVYEDETRVAALTSRVEGRLDKLYVNFTGEAVAKGDPMVTIWSPTLIKSQVELFETIKGRDPDQAVIRGAEEKLIQLGLTEQQVSHIKEKAKPDLYITLRAPINGVVVKKQAVLGQFVKEGSEMFIINDLSQVWIRLDAYETDIPWIRYGQDVIFRAAALPGRDFVGKVLFIDPVLDAQTRTVKIRLEAQNPDLALRPGMFVSAELKAEVDAEGKVIKREWAGKYVCPIHPRDEASSTPGTCPESQMPLRPASSYGYTDASEPPTPLLIPATAPLITGKRAVVYVEVPDRDQPTYDLREVVLGPKSDSGYVVYGGLKESEKVVVSGAFKIDSAMQIMGKPSMMRHSEKIGADGKDAVPQSEFVDKVDAPKEFLDLLTPAISRYLELKEALVKGLDGDARKSGEALADRIREIRGDTLAHDAARQWGKLSKTLEESAKGLAASKDIEGARAAFDPLSEGFAKMLMAFRHTAQGPLFVFHCPMASNKKGAYWVDDRPETRNPYFGEKLVNGQVMLKCGDRIETIPPESSEAVGAHN
jgi:membrane fusion protein, copper/silver efflux system